MDKPDMEIKLQPVTILAFCQYKVVFGYLRDQLLKDLLYLNKHLSMTLRKKYTTVN